MHHITCTNREMARAALAIKIQILGRSLAGIDPSFDINTAKKPRLNLAPRFPNGVNGFSGTDPASISDAATRKQYEEYIAENEKLRDAFNRQLILQRIAKSSVFEAKILLKACANARDDQGVERAVDEIKHWLKDQKTQDELLGVVTNAIMKKAEQLRAK